jgi:hypothetical protein
MGPDYPGHEASGRQGKRFDTLVVVLHHCPRGCACSGNVPAHAGAVAVQLCCGAGTKK